MRLHLLKRSPEKLSLHIVALENQIEHLRNLLDDLRTLSHLDRGQVELNKDFCDISEIVQRVFSTYEPVALAKEQQITLSLYDNIPKMLLDGRQIERVLVNLVANAVNYTPPNRAIRMHTSFDENHIVITVADQGIGISPEDLPRVFERFYRSKDARKSVTSGTGLGLAIAKQIVELHGGTISVTSVLGEGSIFTVRIPG